MELKLSDCSLQDFMKYAMERKEKNAKENRYNLSYMTEARLQKVFEYMCKRKTKCCGSN